MSRRDNPFGCCGAYNDPTCSNGALMGSQDLLGRYAYCKWIDWNCDKENSVSCLCRMCEKTFVVNCETCGEIKCAEVTNAFK
jgi:hypothetical protein